MGRGPDMADRIITEEDLRDRLNLGNDPSQRIISRLRQIVAASHELIRWYCNREFTPTDGAEARLFDGWGDSTVFVDDVLEPVKVETGALDSWTELTLGDIVWYPANEVPKMWLQAPGITFTEKRQSVRVTAIWGYFRGDVQEEPPEGAPLLYMATLDLAARLFNSGPPGGLLSVASESFGGGSVSYGNKTALEEFAPEECLMLSKYRRPDIHLGGGYL